MLILEVCVTTTLEHYYCWLKFDMWMISVHSTVKLVMKETLQLVVGVKAGSKFKDGCAVT